MSDVEARRDAAIDAARVFVGGLLAGTAGGRGPEFEAVVRALDALGGDRPGRDLVVLNPDGRSGVVGPTADDIVHHLQGRPELAVEVLERLGVAPVPVAPVDLRDELIAALRARVKLHDDLAEATTDPAYAALLERLVPTRTRIMVAENALAAAPAVRRLDVEVVEVGPNTDDTGTRGALVLWFPVGLLGAVGEGRAVLEVCP